MGVLLSYLVSSSVFIIFKLLLEDTTEGKDNTGGVIHTETIINDRRRYYIDLRENHRGIFLRVTQFDIQTGNRNSVALPLQGVGQFRDALKEIIDEFGEGYIGLFS